MIGNMEYVLIVIGLLYAILSDYVVVCDVDPSDINSILLEQLKIQKEQLALDNIIQSKQTMQLENQRQQINLLKQLLTKTDRPTPIMEILVSVSCTALGFVVLLFLRRLIKYMYLRYNIRPEMPQTMELMDFAHPNVEVGDLRSLQRMKSPTDYLSCESGEE